MLNEFPAAATRAATDMNKAKQFYTEKLGLKVVIDMGQAAEFEAGAGSRIVMYPRGKHNTVGNHTLVTFTVKDIENVVLKMKEKGVAFEKYDAGSIKTINGVATIGNLKSAWFKDPDGNIIAVFQPG